LAAWVTRRALPTSVFTNRVRPPRIVHGWRWETHHSLHRDDAVAPGYDGEMADSTFDIVSKVDPMELQNAVTQAQKELTQRYDFKGVDPEISHSGETLTLYATSEERVKAVLDVLQSKLVKRGISLKSLDLGASRQAIQNQWCGQKRDRKRPGEKDFPNNPRGRPEGCESTNPRRRAPSEFEKPRRPASHHCSSQRKRPRSRPSVCQLPLAVSRRS
jgi:hypothetical protein